MRNLFYCSLLFLSSAFSVNIRPVLWLTEEAITFLENYLEENEDAKILEFGSGASTLWFAKRTTKLTSMEQ